MKGNGNSESEKVTVEQEITYDGRFTVSLPISSPYVTRSTRLSYPFGHV